MPRLVLVFSLIKLLLCQNMYPSTPVEFRGLWCVNEWNSTQQNYSRQLGQAFFYNNETFTLNFLNAITDTWINHFVMINKTDNQGTYQVFTDTTKGPSNYVNKTSCFWRRQISNGDILWGRQSNGTCTPSFEIDYSPQSTRYTRNPSHCRFVDEENTGVILSNTSFESELLQFDRSLGDSTRQSIVFYGSSSIRLWSTLANDFSDVPVNIINRGFGGSTLKQCWEQFKRVILPLEPRVLILYAGENDVAEGQTPANIQSIFHQLISIIRRFYPSLPVAFISIKPSPSRRDRINQMNTTNSLIRADIQSMKNVYYIDIFNEMLTMDNQPRPELFLSDNLHMNEQGYAIWTRTVQSYLRTQQLISKGLINGEISFLILAFNLLVFLITVSPLD